MTNKIRGFEAAPIFLTLVVSLIAGFGMFRSLFTQPIEASTSAGAVIDPPRQLQDFTLTDQAGRLMHLNDLRGRVALVFFGYTNCPDLCPAAMANFTVIKKYLGDAAPKVVFMFISVDGKHDTSEVLTGFLAKFDPTFIGLTGTEDTIYQIANDFLVGLMRDPTTGIMHSTRSLLVDMQGRLRVAYPMDAPPKTVAAEILKLVNGES